MAFRLLDPGSGTGKTSSYGSGSLDTIFWVKILKFFDADSDPDPDLGIFLTLDPGWKKNRIRDKHLGSGTLFRLY